MRRLLDTLRSHIRYKIIVPYLALTLLVMLVGATIAIGLTAASFEERLQSQLAQIARSTSDSVVRTERNNLEFLRTVAYAPANGATPAVADAMSDPNALASAIAPYYNVGVGNPNLNFDRLIIFDQSGKALLDWQRVDDNPDVPPAQIQGTDLAGAAFVDAIVASQVTSPVDKFSNLIYFAPDVQPYFYTAVPIRRGSAVVGGALVAMKVDRMLVGVEQSSGAALTTFYDLEGKAIGSTLVPRAQLATLTIDQQAIAPLRAGQARSIFDVNINQRGYLAAYSPLLIADSQVGYFSVALARDFQVQSLSISRNTILAIALTLALGSVLLGYQIARSITRPLGALVETAEAVTAGDLERRTAFTSTDEFGKLAVAFNQMTEHLFQLYRTSRELNRAIEIGPVLDVTGRAVEAFVPFTEVLALLIEDGALGYHVRDDAPPEVLALRNVRVSVNDPLLREIVAAKSTKLLDPEREPRLASFGLGHVAGFGSVMITPIAAQQPTAGALIFGHRAPHAFAGANEASLNALANMAVSVLYNAVLFTRVQDEASQRRAILQSIADGVVVCDRQQNIILANPAAEEMLSLHDWHLVRRSFASLPLERVETQKNMFTYGDEIAPPDHYRLGETVMRLSRAPVNADGDQVLGEVIVLHDISSEAAVDQAKTTFIATISHELRSPLTVISGYTQLLVRGLVGDLSGEQKELLESVNAKVDQMSAIVKNMIMVANIEANALDTNLEPQDIRASVENVLAPMRKAFAKKELSVSVAIPDDIPPVLADREQLTIVIFQLLDNARRYTQQGGVTISATKSPGHVQLSFSDTGIGIPPEEFARLFTRFHRVEGNNSPERGSGLGLAISRLLVERQGGRIEAQSVFGHGSTFTITLVSTDEHTHANSTQPIRASI